MQTFLSATLVLVSLGATLAFPSKINVTGLHFKQIFAEPHNFFQSAISGRVIGGEESTAHSRPYEAYIIVTSTAPAEQWLCGGALISSRYILTAGHCVSGAVSAQVLLGAHNVQENEASQVIYTSEELIPHEGYQEDGILNDIGLIKLSESVTLTSEIQIISLPSKSDASQTYEGETVTISGWGLTDGYGVEGSPVLMEVDVKVISHNTCALSYDILQSYQICTLGENGKGSCSGDSGSALIHNNVAIGVVSYGIQHCVSGYPSVFTNVATFLDWIAKNSDVVVA